MGMKRQLEHLGRRSVLSAAQIASPRTILDEVLEPHKLRAAAGPKNTWLVVRARDAAATR